MVFTFGEDGCSRIAFFHSWVEIHIILLSIHILSSTCSCWAFCFLWRHKISGLLSIHTFVEHLDVSTDLNCRSRSTLLISIFFPPLRPFHSINPSVFCVNKNNQQKAFLLVILSFSFKLFRVNLDSLPEAYIEAFCLSVSQISAYTIPPCDRDNVFSNAKPSPVPSGFRPVMLRAVETQRVVPEHSFRDWISSVSNPATVMTPSFLRLPSWWQNLSWPYLIVKRRTKTTDD